MIAAAVRRPVAVLMLFLGLVLIGWQARQRLPVDLLPAINYPNLTVITNWADAPADDLERLVTRPLEEVITGLAGVRRVVSKTREGVSTITVQYDWGTEMDFANLHLREAIDRVSYRDDFPVAADRPLILRWDPSARPIAIMVLQGDEPLARMTEFAREVVKPALEQIQGVSQAELVGGAEREILVSPDFAKLRLYGLDVGDLADALRVANISFPGGRIRKGPLHLPLRILGEFEDLDEIRRTEIPAAGAAVTIGDLAEVTDTTKEPEGFTLHEGREVVSLHLYKEVGENTISTTVEIDRVLAVLGGQYPAFRHAFIYRDADFVQESFSGLQSSLLYGSLLAFVVLYLFLRDWRSPIVVSLAIPVSILATFAFLYFAKVGLNLMSLGGLSLAAGMLVDNSIVVLDNINRRLGLRTGAPVAAECAAGAREVAMPVIAATLTTVAVFFPVIYVPGIAGAFFRDQALTVTISLLVSILAAVLLQPMLSAHILRAPGDRPPALLRPFDRAYEAMAGRYHAALERVLAAKWRFLAVLAAGVAFAAWLGLGLPRTFMPERTRGDFTLALELPAGTPLELTESTAAGLADFLARQPEVASVYSQVGVTERTLASLKEYSAANTARLRVMLHPTRHGRRDLAAVRERLQPRLDALAGTTWAFAEEGVGLREVMASGEAAFTLGVVADDPAEAAAMAESLLPRLRKVPGLGSLEVERVLGNPTVEIAVDREKALRHGLEPDALARELRDRIQGTVATTFNEIEQRIDIAVRLPRAERHDLELVLGSPVQLPDGKTVPLSSFVTGSEGVPVREIVRRDQRRQVTISGDVEGRSVSAAWAEVKPLLASLDVPDGVAFVTGGEQEEINASFRSLGWALLLSCVLVYMILAAQFESFLDPFIVTAVLPVGIACALAALAVTGQSLNIMSLIGLIALLGVDVNDAIVKVATIRDLRAEGLGGRAAILEASSRRLRPILMTTVTTLVGLAPMAFGLGSGDQMQRPLAITIIGGLGLSTVLTLFMTPALYELIHRRTDRRWE